MTNKKKIVGAALWFLAVVVAHAGEIKYPVSEIPDDLKQNVNAVVREDKMVFKIVAQDRATLYTYMAVTIFNGSAKHFAQRTIGYDKLSKLSSFSGSVYDASGKLIKKLKNSDIIDQSAYDGVTLFSDNRYKSADLTQATYPYTVVFEHEMDYKFLYYIPGSSFIQQEKIAVQKASYQLIFPAALTPRYKTFNIKEQPKKEVIDGLESLTWEAHNLKPIKFEPMSRALDIVPYIVVAPSHFEYDGYVGDMDTWQSYGKWIGTLNRGRNKIPDATKEKIRSLTAGARSTEDKARIVYEFVQGRSRYVGIQLGIGGYQPFEAEVVDRTGYGDCKGLSNYTVALLEVVGVRANYVLIHAGPEHELMESFPSSQFNHATVMVPTEKDTLWLECTSQTAPFGYAGEFTGDRKALAITANGATIVNTPQYNAVQNMQSRTVDVFLETNGNAKAKATTTYAGLQYENGGLEFVLDDQFDAQRKWLQANMGIPSFDINSFKMENRKTIIPSAVVRVDLTLNRLATVSGKRLFFVPNLMNRSTYTPEKMEKRTQPVLRKSTFTDVDTIRYHIPEELYPEFLPPAVKLSSVFGEYESSYTIDEGSVVYYRKLKMNKGSFPAETYQKLIDFYKGINKADNVKMVFLNKT